MEENNLDIGKLVGLIMENPTLIEQISALAKGDKQSNEGATVPTVAEENSDEMKTAETEVTPTYKELSTYPKSNNRKKLLGALKPYVSSERASAIDSMLGIADILDLMKTR